MMKRFLLLRWATLLAGLAVIGWVAYGYWGSHPLALMLTALIAAFYLMGVFELRRFQQATQALAQAIEGLSAAPASLNTWLEAVPATLRHAVRRRVEGAPVALPGPALAPTLAGLVVLLGMLGTFVGMVLTLRGTGAALESASDLVAVRNSLVGPVKGLGLAFGTSVAGVAASAALGLLAALCRRERVQVAQRLDACIAGHLRGFSAVHQREESLALMQQQATQMPALVNGLQALMASIERQAELANERLLASQERFHAKADAAYTGLAQALDQTLQSGVKASAQRAGETLHAVASSTLGSIASETKALQQSLTAAMQAQQMELSARFDSSAQTISAACQTLLARQESSNLSVVDAVRASHEGFATTFAQGSSALLAEVAQRHAGWQAEMAAAMRTMAAENQVVQAKISAAASQHLSELDQRHASWQGEMAATMGAQSAENQALRAEVVAATSQHLTQLDQRHASWQAETAATLSSLGRETQALHSAMGGALSQHLDAVAQRHGAWQGEAASMLSGMASETQALQASIKAAAAAHLDEVAQRHLAWQTEMAEALSRMNGQAQATQDLMSRSVSGHLEQVAERLDRTVQQLTQGWQQALSQHEQVSSQLSQQNQQALAGAASQFEQHGQALLGRMQAGQAELQNSVGQHEQQRVQAMTQALEAMAASLRQEWQAAGADTLAQQQRVCETLERTALEITAQAETQARSTSHEIARLMQSASEAPRAAADMVGALRQQLSDSLARDNQMLEERARVLATLGGLVDGMNQSALEQRSAIDALVASSAKMLEHVGGQFNAELDAQTGKLADVAAQVTSSAVEVASLGESFGFAVQLFCESNDKLSAHLQRIDTALGAAMGRSDEQLSYYVSQAREVIDLSLLSQKQIIEDLQRLAAPSGRTDARPAQTASAP
ncbi:DUF802 domain-containing protein [Paucibacter sp. KCTC 42545]|uniref:DUF802 domain-containing protein n=1 Tax=Paucibacter sp. KCTC 42545 TaxID=1768242 RepID=UPI000733BD4A|nr:DUF802 domain-containing protein [Paucibacter sp. KCTC 42545]ALT77128.1 hypothetical protein AT984_07900 [Paucibacter sp. KCTC 42545]